MWALREVSLRIHRLSGTGGRLIASGSVRVRGSQTMRYFPYGDEQTPTANGFDKFATYLRDANGLDYADQRFHHPGIGRFMSADPSMHSTDLGDPQSWNRFATPKVIL